MSAPPTFGFHPDLLEGLASPSPYPAYDAQSLTYGQMHPMPQPIYSQNTETSPPTRDSDLKNNNLFQFTGYSWQSYVAGNPFPEGVVRAGTDSDGTPIYVGRAFHQGDMIPAKVMPDKNVAYVPYGGEEVPKYDFEVLRTGTFVWEFCVNGLVPAGAVEVGQTSDGEKLFYGRCLYEGSQTPGKIQISHGCLYIPYGGQEVSVSEYEVLVLK